MVYEDLQCVVTGQIKTEEEVGLLQTMLVELGSAPNWQAALQAVLQRVCEKTGWLLGQVWLPASDGCLEYGSYWMVGDGAEITPFLRASEEMRFIPGRGLPGRVWSSKRPAWVLDVSEDENFPRAGFAAAAGLKTGVGVPILLEAEVIAVMEFFLGQRRQEDEQFIKTIMAVAAQLGLVFQRRQTEYELRASETRYRTLVENAPVCIHEIDREEKLTAINRAGLKMLGVEREEEVRGMSALELVSPQDQPRVRELLRLAFAGEFSEFEFITATKKPRTFLSCFMPLEEESGRIRHLVGISQDITERKKAENELRQAQKMEAVGRLAGGVAHDFNNLLGVIKGYGEILLEQIPNASSLREPVEEIQKAAIRAVSLTRQLLAFSHQQMLEPAILDVNSIIHDVSNMLSRLLGDDVLLTLDLYPQLGSIKADRGSLDQVIMNLALNARDAMPQGGKLVVETANIQLVGGHLNAAPGRYVVLSVIDNGIGMDADTQAHMFDPFFSTKPPGKGTGLGLTTVYGIVKQSHGIIDVETKPNHGTAVRIYFPRLDQPLECGSAVTGESRAPTSAPDDGGDAEALAGTETIMLVEDFSPMRRLTRELLESCGYSVLECGNAAEAIDVGARFDGVISLLISDVVMPSVSGPRLAEKLLSMRPQMKVLFVSGYANETVVRHGGAGRESTFLQKPYTRQALARTVRRILGPAKGGPPAK